MLILNVYICSWPIKWCVFVYVCVHGLSVLADGFMGPIWKKWPLKANGPWDPYAACQLHTGPVQMGSAEHLLSPTSFKFNELI